MVIIGWIIWCVTLGWGMVCLSAFLCEVFWPNPYPEGPEVLYPLFLRRLITGFASFGFIGAVVVTALTELSKLHLLWFIPVWYLLGVQRWIEWIYLRHEVRKNKIDFFHFLFGDDIMNWDLNTRVLRLEKLTRWLTAINLLLILALITIGILYQRSNLKDVVRAENLAIVDWNGNEVAQLRAYGSLPGLRLLKGPDGKPIPKLGEVKPEPNLRLFDESGIDTVELSSGQF